MYTDFFLCLAFDEEWIIGLSLFGFWCFLIYIQRKTIYNMYIEEKYFFFMEWVIIISCVYMMVNFFSHILYKIFSFRKNNILFRKNNILFFFFTVLVYFLSEPNSKLKNKHNYFVWELETQEINNTIFYVSPLSKNINKESIII